MRNELWVNWFRVCVGESADEELDYTSRFSKKDANYLNHISSNVP